MYAARLATDCCASAPAQLFRHGRAAHGGDAGVELIADYHEVAVVGITEVLHKIPSVVIVQNRLAREAARRKAPLAILVDSPGTHLGVARRLKKHDIPVGYFIGPQIWAWRAGRVRVVKRAGATNGGDLPLRGENLSGRRRAGGFVGHPLVDVVRSTMNREAFAAQHGLDPAVPIVTLLPGSRRNEIAQHFPTILDACERLAQSMAARRTDCNSCMRLRRVCAAIFSPLMPGPSAAPESIASKVRRTMRWPRPIAPSWPAARRQSKRRCSARRWS